MAFRPNPSETQRQLALALQVSRYLLEMFSIPLLRSHATVSLVDPDRLQLYHANCSVILVSSVINFSEGDKLNATVIAFRCPSLEQNGILETRVPGNAALVSSAEFRRKLNWCRRETSCGSQKTQRANRFRLHLVGLSPAIRRWSEGLRWRSTQRPMSRRASP